MEWAIRHGGIQQIELYNCSAMTPSEWSLKRGEVHFPDGLASLIYGIFIELLYIPCILILTSWDLLQHSCFKIMLILGIVDMLAISVNSVINGYLLTVGAVFCSHPNLIYISGSIGLGLWCCSCMISLVLMLNRLLDLWRPDIANFFFHGHRTFLVMACPILYGLYFILFTPPLLFNSKYHAWFFDPFIFEGRAHEYENWPHTTNNFAVVGASTALYVFFIIVLYRKTMIETHHSQSRAHRQVFLQSAVICMFTLTASIIYVTMNFIEVPVWLILIGHITWQLDHSCPAFIYLVMNRTIRHAALNKLGILRAKRAFKYGKKISTLPTTEGFTSNRRSTNDLMTIS